MRFKVGDPIDSRVGKKIQSLQDTFGAKDGSKRRNYIELQSAVPWIRMQSGVRMNKQANLDFLGNEDAAADALAKKYVLFGSNTRIETKTENSEGKEVTTVSYNQNTSDINLSGYKNTDNLGIRPQPGITGMQIQSHNRFGSLRTATVRFQCWSKEDMDALEVLYMRPGYSVLLEWGHSKNLTVDGSNVELADLGIDFYEIADNSDAVYQEIVKKRLSNHYGYDAILGTIKNFSWKFRPDGGYDCSVDLISPGELIESYKANFYLSQEIIQQDLSEEWSNYIQSSGDTDGLFPNVSVEDPNHEFKLGALPSLATAYANFVAQAREGLDNLKAASQLMTEDTANAVELAGLIMDKALGNGTEATNIRAAVKDAEVTFLVDIHRIIQLLEVARGGLPVEEYYVERGFDIHYTYSSITVGTEQADGSSREPEEERTDTGFIDFSRKTLVSLKSKWTQGIADLNVGNNITDSGLDVNLPDGGYVAVLPVGANGELAALYKELFDRYNDGDGISAIHKLIRAYITVLCEKSGDDGTGNILYGDIKTQWEHPAYTTPSSFADQDMVTPDSSNNTTWTSLNRSTNTSTAYIDFETNNATSTYSDDNVSRKMIPLDSSYSDAGNTDLEVIKKWAEDKGYTYSDRLATASSTEHLSGGKNKSITRKNMRVIWTIPSERPPFDLFPLKYKGYNPNKQIGGTTLISNNTDLQEEIPTDQYLSKLHYYLRQFVEKEYANNYLSTPDPNEIFTDRFMYRANPSLSPLSAALGNTPRNYTSPPRSLSSITNILGGIFVNTNNMTFRDTVYVKLGLVLELINRHILRSYSDYFFSFVTDYSDSPPQYFTFIDHISMDPRYCILPHTLKSGNLNVKNYTGDGSPTILDIELNVNFVLDTLAKYLGNDGRAALLDFMHDILDNISRVCGGVNDFQLQFVEDSHTVETNAAGEEEVKVFRSKFHIVDRRAISPIAKTAFIDNGAQLNLYGINTVIQNIDLVSKLTPKISSMIAISAQDSPYTTGEEATGFNAINKGLTDRIFTRRYEIEGDNYKKALQESDTLETIEQRILEDLNGVLQNLGLFYELAAIPPLADEQIAMYENFAKFMIGISSQYDSSGIQDSRLTYNFIIPFQLNLTLYGISGIKVMDAFVTSQDILPKTYGGRPGAPIAFLVTGVEHVIDRNGWKTMLKTQIYNIDEETPKTLPGKDRLFVDEMKAKAKGLINYTVGLGSTRRGAAVDLTGTDIEPLIKYAVSNESGGDYGIANTTSNPTYYAISTTDVSTLTIAQILDDYAKRPLGDGSRVFAAGKYQIIPGTLEGILNYEYVKNNGVTRNSKYDAATQEILGRSLFLGPKQPAVQKYLTGVTAGEKADLQEAIQGLAQEFASCPTIRLKNGTVVGDLDTNPQSNYGYHGPTEDEDGNSVNPKRVRHTIEDSAKVLIKSRMNYHGNTPPYNPFNVT